MPDQNGTAARCQPEHAASEWRARGKTHESGFQTDTKSWDAKGESKITYIYISYIFIYIYILCERSGSFMNHFVYH